jgi:hypothetical protein
VGLVAYGLVHLLIGWLAVQLAIGDHDENASADGALQTLARQPFGQVLVGVVALGLLLLALWRLVEALFGHRDEDSTARRTWQRVVSGGKAVVYGALGGLALRIALGGGSSGGSGSKGLTAKVMSLPAGQWLVVAVGVGILVFAGVLMWRGWTEKFAEDLQTEGKLGYSGAAYLLLGKVGYVAKGIAFAVLGGLFCYAGLAREPDESGGLDQALQKVLQQPFGPYLLIVIGVGIACYGLFCLAQARHLDR